MVRNCEKCLVMRNTHMVFIQWPVCSYYQLLLNLMQLHFILHKKCLLSYFAIFSSWSHANLYHASDKNLFIFLAEWKLCHSNCIKFSISIYVMLYFGIYCWSVHHILQKLREVAHQLLVRVRLWEKMRVGLCNGNDWLDISSDYVIITCCGSLEKRSKVRWVSSGAAVVVVVRGVHINSVLSQSHHMLVSHYNWRPLSSL